MKKIIIVGTTGSGKSTLSAALKEKLNLHYIQLDALHWQSNWQNTSTEELLTKLKAEIKAPMWVIDGNYGKTHGLTWPEADTIIWIDLPFMKTFIQNFTRSLTRAFKKEKLWGTNNQETIARLFSRESILKWLFKTYRKNRKQYLSRMQDPQYAHLKFIRLKSRKEVTNFISKL